MGDSGERRYPARISFRHTGILFATAGSLFAAGMVLMFRQLYPGLLLAGIFGGLFAWLLFQVLAVGSHYTLTDEGMTAQRMYRQRHFPWTGIDDAVLVPDSEAAGVCQAYQVPVGEKTVSKFRAANRLGQLIEYCSVNIHFPKNASRTTSGLRHPAASDDAFVLVKLHDGKAYLLSPKQPREFFREVQIRRR